MGGTQAHRRAETHEQDTGATKRQHRVVAAAVVAAVLAIGVPTVVVLTQRGGVAPDPSAPSTGPLQVVLRTDVETGPAPRIPYMLDGRIVLPSGGRIEVGQQLSSLTPYGDGWMGLMYDQGVPTAVVLDQQGHETRRFVSGRTLATDITHTRTAYTHRFDSGGTLNLEGGGSHATWTFAENSSWQPVGILGPGTVVYDDDSIDPVAMVAGPHGTRPITGLQWAFGVSPDGYVSARVSLDEKDGRACYVVRDAASERVRFRTCRYSLWKFSPDGRYVFAHQPVFDGNFVGRSVAILDARSGDPVVEYAAEDPSGPWIRDVAWEDETHLLASVYDGTDRWFILRLSLDGNITNVSGTPLPGSELDSPVLFSAQP